MAASRQSARRVKLTTKFEEFKESNASRITIGRQSQSGTPTPARSTPITSLNTSMPVQNTPKITIKEPSATRLSIKREAQSTSMPLQCVPTSTSCTPKLTANGKVRGRPRKIWASKTESVGPKIMPSTREELNRLREENANLKLQVEEKTNDYTELLRQSSYTGETVPKIDFDELKLKYQRELEYAKRHEWCVVCLAPSRYYCCWNTTYCSQKCQVSDWYERHNKLCERKRALEMTHQNQPSYHIQ